MNDLLEFTTSSHFYDSLRQSSCWLQVLPFPLSALALTRLESFQCANPEENSPDQRGTKCHAVNMSGNHVCDLQQLSFMGT